MIRYHIAIKILLLFIFIINSILIMNNTTNYNINDYNIQEKLKEEEWETFILALTWVESRHDNNAKNPNSSALGRFQQLKIYVDDVNRIIGFKKYNYDDRINPVKAREMFDIIQNYYNPDKDINIAIRKHRGLNSISYKKEVYAKMKEYEENRIKSMSVFK